jgi:hypothetical protein
MRNEKRKESNSRVLFQKATTSVKLAKILNPFLVPSSDACLKIDN